MHYHRVPSRGFLNAGFLISAYNIITQQKSKRCQRMVGFSIREFCNPARIRLLLAYPIYGILEASSASAGGARHPFLVSDHHCPLLQRLHTRKGPVLNVPTVSDMPSLFTDLPLNPRSDNGHRCHGRFRYAIILLQTSHLHNKERASLLETITCAVTNVTTSHLHNVRNRAFTSLTRSAARIPPPHLSQMSASKLWGPPIMRCQGARKLGKPRPGK